MYQKHISFQLCAPKEKSKTCMLKISACANWGTRERVVRRQRERGPTTASAEIYIGSHPFSPAYHTFNILIWVQMHSIKNNLCIKIKSNVFCHFISKFRYIFNFKFVGRGDWVLGSIFVPQGSVVFLKTSLYFF